MQRSGAVVERCGDRRSPLALEVAPHESLFTAVSDPLEAPEVFQLRRTLLSWRFYDSFRTDRLAPARLAHLSTRTPSLAAIGDAFPGCRLAVDTSQPSFRLQLHQQGLLRPLDAAELSDGTLHYLVLNEPENSLHPDLLPPLARLIDAVAQRTQVWVIAHAEALITTLQKTSGCRLLQLEREQGATLLPGQSALDRAAWRWPS
ncbi:MULTISPECIES: AAA family ATPase [unclassified Cyanobium]|uniref:AAA family ATPase n=1 Tax=unclassified Cyanobium TaxID=2627006 RepID=UPI002A3A8525|nr:hypothetical protein [Cyanobium sp. A2C-AMD]